MSDYYKLAKDNSNSSGNAPINLRMPTNEQVGFTPVITRSNFFVQGFAERNPAREASTPPNEWCLDTTGNGRGTAGADWADASSDWYNARGYRYSLGMFPLITLWNPYDRDMVLDDLGLEFELYPIDIVNLGGSVIANVGQHTSKYNGAKQVNRQTVKFVIRGITLEAGAAVNFSPPCNSYYDKDIPSNNVLVARASAPYVNGFFTPSTLPESPYTTPTDPRYDERFWGKWDGSIEPVPARWMISNKDRKSRLTLQFTNTSKSLWRQLVMLYSSTDLVNRQFRTENRFKTAHPLR